MYSFDCVGPKRRQKITLAAHNAPQWLRIGSWRVRIAPVGSHPPGKLIGFSWAVYRPKKRRPEKTASPIESTVNQAIDSAISAINGFISE